MPSKNAFPDDGDFFVPQRPQVPMNLWLQLALPDELACEVTHTPGMLEELGERITTVAKQSWRYEVEQDPPDFWPELKESTIARKKAENQPFPDKALRGSGEMLDRMEAIPPTIAMNQQELTPTDRVTEMTVNMGPNFADDLSPSEQIRDQFAGSPADYSEAARYGQRGIVPPRPLGWDQRTRNAAAQEVKNWAHQYALGPYLCFEESVNRAFAIDVPDPMDPHAPPTLEIEGPDIFRPI